jgi:hypothetical protein
MAGLTFIPYELPGNGSQKFSADKFRLIDDFAKPCDEPAKSASQSTDRSVSRQRGELASKVRDRSSPAELIDPYRNFPKDLVKWLYQEPVSDYTDFNEQKGDKQVRSSEQRR